MMKPQCHKPKDDALFFHQFHQVHQFLQVEGWVAVCFFLDEIEEAGQYLQLPVFVWLLHQVPENIGLADNGVANVL